MALNSSGPISLGGATVGQSINLELGQAATALTSLNATNVRTLLQVPSGQISLSNAYGKSSNSYWVVYLGIGKNQGNSRTDAVVNPDSLYVTNNGVSAIHLTYNGGSRAGSKFSYVGNDGTIVASADYGSTAQFYMLTGNTNSSSNRYPLAYTNGGSNWLNVVDGTGSYTTLVYGNGGTVSPEQPLKIVNGCFASDNTYANVGFSNRGKSGWYYRYTKYGASGGATISLESLNGGSSYYANGASPSLLVRSDNSYASVVILNGGGYPTDAYYVPLTSSLVFNGGGNWTRVIASGYTGSCINLATNVVYSIFQNKIGVLNSSLTTCTLYEFSGRRTGQGPRMWGAAFYNGIVYFGCSYDNGGSTQTTPSFTICAWNTATQTFSWAKNIQLSGGQQYSPFFNFDTYNGTAIYANSNGVFFACYGIDTYGGESFLFKFPLDGNITNATYTNVGPSINLTISSQTMTVVGTTTSNTSSGLPSQQSKGSNSSITLTPTTLSNPTFTKTALT